jgi:putative ABC transport system permease protein
MAATTRLALLGVRRRRRGQVIALALVTALAAAAIVTGLAAQRSATDLVDRAYQRAGRPDLVLVGHADALHRAAGDPAVTAASDPAPVAALEIDVDGEPVQVRLTAVDPHALPVVARPDLVAGRWPTAGTREVVVERSAAAGTARIGDRIQVTGPAGAVELTVVATAVDLTGCFRPLCQPLRLLGPADLVTKLAGSRTAEHVTALRLRDPASARAVQSRLLAADPDGLGDASAWPDTREEILEGPQLVGAFAGGFGVFLIAVACLVVAGATSARLVARRRAFGLLKAVGYRPGQLTTATLAEHLAIGAAGVVAGWVGGSLLAPAVQVGIEGLGDRPSAQFATGPLLAALALVEAILALSVIVPAWHAGHQPAAEVLRDTAAVRTGGARLAALARRLGAGPSTVTGLRRALARPLRATLAGGALLVAAVGAMIAVGFIGVIDLSSTDSADTGIPWTAYATPTQPTRAAQAQVAAVLDATPEVAAWYTEQTTQATVGNDAFTVRVLGGDPDAAGYLVREGRPASGPGQAMVGYGFLARTGHHVGDTIDLHVGGATATLEIVGWFSDLAEGGQIIQLRQQALPASVALEEPPTFRLVAADGVAPTAMAAAVAKRLGDGATVIAPRRNDGGRAQGIALFTVLTMVLGGIAAANLLAVTVAGQRERARSLGILRAVGCTTGQLVGQSATGTALIGLLAGIVGAPLGWLLFRVIADATTKAAGLGPNPIPAPSWAALAAVIIGVTVTAAATGALAAVGLTRRPAAELVRYE